MWLSRKISPWEVVDRKVVAPVLAYSNKDDHLRLIQVSHTGTRGTYLFDMKDPFGPESLRRAIVFSRQQLLKETSKQGYNALLMEGWEVINFQKGAKRRVEVQYRGLAALMSGDVSPRLPPFLELLSSKM